MKKSLLFCLALALSGFSALAQQKMKDGTVNNGNLPNKDAILELESANKGVLFSRVSLKSAKDPSPLSAHTAGMMVYNTQTISDVVPGIYYNDGTKWILARQGQANNLSYNPLTYSITFNDPVSNSPVVINLQDVVRKNETLTTLVKQENGTYIYTAEDGRKTIINVPADVINSFQTIADNSSVRNIIENIVKNTGGNVFFDGTSLTYVDKNGVNQIIRLDQIIKGGETVTTLIKNVDGTYTYTNEKSEKVSINVIGDVNTNILNESNLYTTIKNVIDKEETVTSLVYDALKNTLTYTDENKVANTLDLAKLIAKNQSTSTLSNSETTEIFSTTNLNNTDFKVEVKNGSISSNKLASNAVISDKIASKAITGNKVADKTIGAEKLVALATDKDKVGVVQADGSVVYQTLSSSNIAGKDLTAEDGSIAVTDGAGATLVNSKLKVADGGISTAKLADGSVTNVKVAADAITTDKIKDGEVKTTDLGDKAVTGGKVADKTIGAEKLTALATDKDKVGVVQADGSVVYQTLSSSNIAGKDLTAEDGSIAVTDGAGATLVNSKLKVADGGISTAKLADGSVTNVKVAADAITTDKIKDGEVKTADLANKNVTAEKLTALATDKDKVGVVQADGSVVYQTLSSSNIAGKDLTAEDGSIAVTDGAGATLVNSKLKVADGGISTAKLADGSVTNVKIAADAITTDKIKDGEVKTADLGDKAVTGNKVADKTIGAEKLIALATDKDKVGVVQADGSVVYQTLSSSNIAGKDLTAEDGSIAVTDGAGATLVNSKLKVADGGISTAKLADGSVTNVKIAADAITTDKIKDGEVKTADLGDKAVTGNKVADKTIGAEKLIALATDKDKVGVVQADGSVVYQTLSSSNIAGKDLTAEDGSIAVTDGAGATLVNSKLKVADGGISTAKLADGSVTNVKIAADAITTDKIKDGEVKTADLGDKAVTGNKVADKTIGAEKLIALATDKDKVGVVQADGSIVYQTLSSSNIAGKDLTAEDGSIAVTDGTGATLVNSKLKVADGGISTAKLADGSVSNVKIAADAITTDKIKDGEVKTADLGDKAVTGGKVADKTIGAEKLTALATDKDKVGVVQADGSVVYQTLSSSNIAGKDLTAEDGSIVVTDGAGATLVNSKLKVADGGISTAKLADGSVTNVKIAADAITTDKIKDGEVKTADLANKNVTAEKLTALATDKDKVGVVQADGSVVYQTLSSSNIAGKDLTAEDGSIAVTDGAGATLVNSKLKVADGGISTAKLADGSVTNVKIAADAITTDKIKDGEVKTADLGDKAVTGNKVADKTIGAEKLIALATDKDKVGVVQADGSVVYQTLSSSNIAGKDLTAEDGSIAVTDGAGATLVNSKLKVADGGISTAKLADGSVTNVKVAADAITTDKIKDGEVKTADLGDKAVTGNKVADKTIGAEKLIALATDKDKVGVVQADGSIVYQTLSSSNIAGKDLTAEDGSIAVTDGAGATLVNSKLKVADGGISTAKLADGSVTNVKIAADAITTDKIKDGEVKTADLGDKAVTGNKVADKAITSDKVADKTIGAEKLTALATDKDKVGVVQADGSIVYQTLSSSNIAGKDLTAEDGSIAVTDGTGATLVNSKLKVADGGITTSKLADGSVTNVKVAADAITTDKIKDGEVKTADLGDKAVTGNKVADKTIGAEKLIALATDKDKVGVVQADGSIVYQTLSSSNIAGKDLTAEDGSIAVTDGAGATLVNSKLKVADGGISTAKLADGSVTNVKIAADAITTDKIKDGEVKTADLGDKAVTGNKVADKAIGAEKLIALATDKDKVGVVQADGSIVYQTLSSSNIAGKDLTAEDGSIAVTDGAGATLMNSKLKVADGGISTAKLADGSVTNVKVAADAITTDKIKDGEVKTADLANKNVTAEKLVALATDKDKVGVVQADGSVVYQTLSSSNIAGKDLTAEDGSIAVTDGTGATLVNSKLKVADGGISTAKLADGSVTNVKIAADAITTDKIKDGEVKTADLGDKAVTGGKVADKTIGAEKLVALATDKDKVGVVQADGSVVYQTLSSSNIAGKDLTAEDGSIAVTDGAGATLVNSKLKVADGGISTAKLADGSVTNIKVAADAITTDKIKDGEVKTADLGDKAVTGGKVADKTIGAEKLTALATDKDKVGVVQADGSVVYQTLSSSNIAGKDLTAEDGSIAVTDGAGATLVNSKLKVADGGITTAKLADGSVTNVKIAADAITTDKIKDGEVKTADLANKNVTAEKLTALATDKDKVGVVQADGSVVYQTLSSSNIAGKDLTAEDGSIAVTDGAGATLVNSKLKVADGGISTAKLADGSVTNVKVAADAITTDKIKDGEVKTANLGDKAVTGDKVADKTIGAEKLVALATDKDKVGVVQADGSVVYQTLSSSNIAGKDLTAEDGSIAVTDGAGATLVNSKLKVADGGISTAKLADGSVTNVKVAADAITTDKIKDGAITSAKIKDGEVKVDDIAAKAVTSTKLDAGLGTAGRLAIADATGAVTFSNAISSGSITGENVTAGSSKVSLGGTPVGAALKAFSVDVNEASLTLSNLGGKVTNNQITTGTANQILVTNAAGTSTEWVNKADVTSVSNISTGNSISTTVNGKTGNAVNIINTNALTLDATNKLVSTVNGVASAPALDLSTAVLATQKITTVSNGTNATAVGTTTGNATDYKVNVATANATTIGVVKQAANNAAVTINSTGELGVNANNGLTVANGNVQLGGTLNTATTITTGTNLLSVATGGNNTMAVTGLQTGVITDQIVVADASGILKQVKAAMPKFFYMPSVVIPTASDQFVAESGVSGESFGTINLYDRYSKQFLTAAAKSTGAPALPTLPKDQLYYYVTWFDTAVFTNVQISPTGVLTYTVLANADVTIGSFMNVVFAVK